jgi:hypothetical protein
MYRQHLKKRFDDPDHHPKAHDVLNTLKLPHLSNFATFHSKFVFLAQASKRSIERKENLHDKLYADLQIHLESDLRDPTTNFDTYCERAQYIFWGVERAGKQRKEVAEARRKASASSTLTKYPIAVTTSKPTHHHLHLLHCQSRLRHPLLHLPKQGTNGWGLPQEEENRGEGCRPEGRARWRTTELWLGKWVSLGEVSALGSTVGATATKLSVKFSYIIGGQAMTKKDQLTISGTSLELTTLLNLGANDETFISSKFYRLIKNWLDPNFHKLPQAIQITSYNIQPTYTLRKTFQTDLLVDGRRTPTWFFFCDTGKHDVQAWCASR